MKRARDIRDQLEGLVERVEIEICSNASDLDAIKKAITSGMSLLGILQCFLTMMQLLRVCAVGFFHHSARLQRDGTYKTVKNPQTVHIHPSSGLSEASSFDCTSSHFHSIHNSTFSSASFSYDLLCYVLIYAVCRYVRGG
jgi:hypothetical protein